MIGVVAGVLPLGLLPRLPPPELMGLMALAGLGLCFIGHSGARLLGGLLLGLSFACSQGQAMLERRLSDACVALDVNVEGSIASLPRLTQVANDTLRQRFELRVHSIAPASCAGPRKLLVSYYGSSRPVPGEQWHMVLRLKKPWGLANPGSFNMQAWFASSAIDGVGSVRSNQAIRLRVASGIDSLHHRVRLLVRERINTLDMAAGVKAILAAVTVADKSGIDGRMWGLLQQFGINHLLVISGLHIGLVAGVGYLLGKGIARPLALAGWVSSWLPAAMGFAIALIYAALAGFSLPTEGALIMLGCFCLAPVLGRESVPANNLLLAAFLILLLNPLAPLDSGFWLSFGAVAALLWLLPWQRRHGRVMALLKTHVFMSVFMLPLGGWWFGGASLVAAPANLLMIPLIGLLVVPLALVATTLFLMGSPLDIYLWRWAGLPLSQLLPVAQSLVTGLGQWFYLPLAPSLVALPLALFGVALLALPWNLPRLLTAVILIGPIFMPTHDADKADTPRVAFLDVGQGTSVLIQSGQRALLYDTGGGDPAGSNMAASVVLPYIRHRGLDRLDTLIVSHPDRDHSAGMGTLMAGLPIGRIRRGGEWPQGSPGKLCRAGEAWHWPTGERFQILAPAHRAQARRNNASCVLMIEIGPHRLLLPGDIETSQELELVRYWTSGLKSNVLMAAHHGSRTSSSWAWLKTVQPARVVITSGYANRFGHPHPDVLARLEAGGARVRQTWRGGALELYLPVGEEAQVRPHREQKRRFWM